MKQAAEQEQKQWFGDQEKPAERFDAWCVVDLFGHQKIAGRVTEQALGGASFVRVDVPEIDGKPGFTRFFGAAAIYSITPTTEEMARAAAKYVSSEPISIYIPARASLPREREDDGHDEDIGF